MPGNSSKSNQLKFSGKMKVPSCDIRFWQNDESFSSQIKTTGNRGISCKYDV